MARFRAYTSDSSDDESASEREAYAHNVSRPTIEDEGGSDRESSESSSSSSDFHEDELVTTPERKTKQIRNTLVEGEDGEIQYSHEINHDRAKPTVRISPSRRSRADPTIIPWAQRIGVDAQKMHVMQTSLFRMPEEAAALKAQSQPTRPQLRVPPQTRNRKHSRESDGDSLRLEPRERASFAHDIEPLPHRPSRKYARVESSASAVDGNEGAVVDAGLAFGRSFRAGWGPGGTLVHLGELCGPSSTSKISANSSVILKTMVPVFSKPGGDDATLSSKLLQHHLTHSPIEPDDDGIPFANPSTHLRFSSFASLFPLTDRSFEASLFRLGEALFDEIDFRLGDSTVDIRNRVSSLRRKVALSSWLENAVIPAVDANLKENPAAESPTIAFTLLTGNQVEKACETAMDGGYLKLATLISQAGGDFDFREDLKDQLLLWREQKIDVHINQGVRKVYALLAGIIDEVLDSPKGVGLERGGDIDVVNGLDWKRTFGLHLWFSEPIDASIAQVFQAYSRLTKDSSPGRIIAGPLPWYKEQASPISSRWKLPLVPPPDAFFSLIRLHAEPACSLSNILTPLSFGMSPVDYSLPWHLYIILSRCMRVRDFADRGDSGIGCRGGNDVDMDGSESDTSVEGHSPSADLLASSYAFQLEGSGMIQEALFVLLHIEGSAGREKAVKDLLLRSADKLDEWMTRGVVGSLKIPMAWLNEAKAIYARYNGNIYEAYEFYITAGLYNAAHDLAVLELAPDAVIRRDLVLLKNLFAKFALHPVNGWHVRGKAFLDYVQVMTRLPVLQEQQEHDAVADASQALELEELIRTVPKLLGLLPDVLRDRSDARHNAALAEMITGLTMTVDKVRPLALSNSQIQPTLVDEASKLRHIHSTAHARFLKTIDMNLDI